MSRKLELFVAAMLAIVLLFSHVVDRRQQLPDFAAIDDVQLRKQAFIDYLQPIVEDINSRRAAERKLLQSMHESLLAGKQLSYLQRRQLKLWAQRYDVDFQPDQMLANIEALLLHLDQIPASMVIAQAAMESAWGTSRFVTGGYNFFGQWCYKKGCGMVPGERQQGASHEVKKFSSTRDALYAYFRNINSHPAYRQLRKLRAQARAAGEVLSGQELVAGLQKYSQRGKAYIDDLRAVIRFNNLE